MLCLWVFNRTDQQRGGWDARQVVIRVGPGLARASVLAGDTAKARKAFKDFFELWKDADQNLPILIEAKKDYAALH
jgi:hypothetical protein